MKREIKFRGKRVESGEWIVGYLFQDDDDHFPMIHQGGTLDGWEQVKEETIGQFTGLTDKNGKEIYEGDILISSLKDMLVEVWYSDEKATYIGEIISPPNDMVDYLSNFEPNTMIIAGNRNDDLDELLNNNI